MKTVEEILQYLYCFAPKSRAYSWDNIGLMVGDGKKEVRKAMVCLDVTNDVLTEAQKKEINLIISHHPLIFTSLHSVDFSSQAGKKIAFAIKNDIAIISLHTNFDCASFSVSHMTAKKLGLSNVRLFSPEGNEKFSKIQVFIPPENKEPLLEEMFKAGGGDYEKYDSCCYVTSGEGQFRAKADASPYIGEVGETERVNELKIEMIVKNKNIPNVVSAIHQYHPYETPAFDVFPDEIGENYGLGVIGELPCETKENEFLECVCRSLSCSGLKFSRGKGKIKTVAVAGGACGELIESCTADAFITSEVKHHQYLFAKEKGILLIDGGHYTTEKAFCGEICALLESFAVEALVSSSESSPEEYFVSL